MDRHRGCRCALFSARRQDLPRGGLAKPPGV